ncbi:MAG: DUF4349 domain-containing protein [Actinomycetota bacterium]|nr:DUF4349 domain-containing protein [Actinomycetota bacterium]
MTPDMTPDALDTEIRRSLQTEALAIEPPDDLAERTLARALDPASPQSGGRARRRVVRMPLVLSVSAAAAVVTAFFVVGVVATGSLSTSRTAVSPPLTEQLQGGAAPPSAGAAQAPQSQDAPASGTVSPAPAPAPAPPPPQLFRSRSADRTTAGRTPPVPEPGPPSPFGPRIARTAYLQVRVDKGRFDERWRQAESIAGRYGGNVATSSAQEVEGRLARGNLTLHVPADKLQGVLDEMRGLGTPVQLTSAATDVSGQLVDYEARLRAAQANEAALLDLARQARSLEDNLALRPRLQEARREIESLQAQRASLQGQVDLATVTASLYERDAAPSSEPEGRVGQAWSRAGDAAAATLAGMIIAASYLGPFAALAVALWALATTVRRRRYI